MFVPNQGGAGGGAGDARRASDGRSRCQTSRDVLPLGYLRLTVQLTDQARLPGMAVTQRGVCPTARMPLKGLFFLEERDCRYPAVPVGNATG
ncbi:hypothetical protein C8F00_0463 [Xanthomonas vasicola]